MYIGTYPVLLLSTQPISALKWWGIIGGILGIALIVLNVYTFPILPADKGLLDLGPYIALFLLALHTRTLALSQRMQ